MSEMKQGEKVSHWIWYVFPQVQGLGLSGTTAYFSIRDLAEAKDYYEHPILGARLIEITSELLNIETDDPMIVFEYPDAFKVRSCMTLFKCMPYRSRSCFRRCLTSSAVGLRMRKL